MTILVWAFPAPDLQEQLGPQEWQAGAAYSVGWAAYCQALSGWPALEPQPRDSIGAAWFRCCWYESSLKGRNCLPLWAPGWAHAGLFRQKPPLDSLQGCRKEQQPDSVATEKKFRFLPVWVQTAPAGCFPALRDAPAYQVRLEHQRQVYGCAVHSASGKSCYCLFGYSRRQLAGKKYPQVVLRPEPGGKDCRGFGAFRRFSRPLP